MFPAARFVHPESCLWLVSISAVTEGDWENVAVLCLNALKSAISFYGNII